MKLILYQTDFCQLCDEAASLVYRVLEHQPADLELVDISLDDQLLEQYATLIPVLVTQGPVQQQLNWPFTQEDILEFLVRVGG